MNKYDLNRNDLFVGEGTTFQGKVVIEKDVKIWQNCIIGFSENNKTFSLEQSYNDDKDTTFIGEGAIIRPFSIIYEGTKIGKNVEIYEHSRVGYRTIIREDSKIVYGAKIYNDVIIGKRSIIQGFCCNNSKIGNETTMMGHLLHKYPIHAIDIWDDKGKDDPSPVIEDNVIVGYNALIIGGITIGKNSYIAAGAIICHDVPSNTKIISSQTYKLLKR